MDYQDDSVRFELLVEGVTVRATFHGTSTLPGTEAFINEIENQIARQGLGVIRILMDLGALKSVPMRVHLKMSTWLLQN